MTSNFCRRARLRLSGAGCLVAALSAVGCGVEFDSIGQIDGLRVLGVQKDKPLPRPGDTVNLRMVFHDTGDADGEPRELSFFWLAGCENPPGDAYQGCLLLFRDIASKLGDVFTNGGSDLTEEELSELGTELASSGASFGFDETFQTRVSADIVSGKPESAAPYGLSFVFFAACAGELRPDATEDGFPVACYDADGERLGARDFVAGYTSMYTYEDQTNRPPRITGMRVKGQQVPRSRLCISDDCEPLAPDPKRTCESGAPRVARCKRGALRQTCPELDLAVVVDPESVDQDAPLALGGEGLPEPMWVNYHTDSGSFTSDLVLVNDIQAGFRSDVGTTYLAAEEAGPAFIWAAVRDNRGGFAWARTSVCVE